MVRFRPVAVIFSIARLIAPVNPFYLPRLAGSRSKDPANSLMRFIVRIKVITFLNLFIIFAGLKLLSMYPSLSFLFCLSVCLGCLLLRLSLRLGGLQFLQRFSPVTVKHE